MTFSNAIFARFVIYRVQQNLVPILDCQNTAVTVLLCLFFNISRQNYKTIKSISTKLIEVMVKLSCIGDAVYTLFLFSMLFEASMNLPIVHRIYTTANVLIPIQEATARYLRKLR